MNWIDVVGIVGTILLFGGLISSLISPFFLIAALFTGELIFKIGTACFLFGFYAFTIGGVFIGLAGYLESTKRF